MYYENMLITVHIPSHQILVSGTALTLFRIRFESELFSEQVIKVFFNRFSESFQNY